MPYEISDVVAQRISNILRNLGPLDQIAMVSEQYHQEISTQEQDRARRGLMPNGAPRAAEITAAAPAANDQPDAPRLRPSGDR